MFKRLFPATALCLLALLSGCSREQPLRYPPTKKVDQVDDYFGVRVPDPYRWLEDDNAEEVKQWVREQNAVTFAYLSRIPFREQIRRRLREIFDYPRYGAPMRAGDYYFFTKNDGLQNQSVLYVQKGLAGTPEVFIDPNALSPDGTIRVSLVGFSNDDRYVAVSHSEAGSDWSEIRVMEIASKRELADRIRWVKFSGAAWHGQGFYYSGYDRPAPGHELTAKNEYQKVFYHRLGDPQEKDAILYQDREHPLRYVSAETSEDERFLFLSVTEGTHGNELYCMDLGSGRKDFRPLIRGFEFNNTVIDNVGDRILVHTDAGAPNYRVVAIDPTDPAPDRWREIVPERPEVLSDASAAGGRLYCSYLKDANTKVAEYDLTGKLLREIELPALGTASGFYGKRDEKVLFYTFTSFTYPPTIYRYDPATGRSEVFRKAEIRYRPEDYEVKQVFYESKDKTRIPMFLVHRKGLERNGKNPVYLYGYGGFNSSMVPSFNPARIFLLENGVLYAQACLRGGGEYGENWHKAGMLLNKQNVFDDFIAAAEYLIRERYTSPNHLAMAGASNGGLLVGAAMTQRPELFRVALPAVGVMDMLRFHKFTVGWGWTVEYGSSDDEKHFRNLYSYSPLHNLRDGVSYPATLITTADHDDRVVPAHSFKFAATLQEKHRGPNPVLIRIDTRSGHGASNVSKLIDRTADEYAFMLYHIK